MKILHTSDWHLGKRLEGKSRLPEQERALDALAALAAETHADALVVAGDVFDTVNPPAEAEALFYDACLRIGRTCPVIVIAGNHDNPERLSAPDGIARACDIVLCGGLDCSQVKQPLSGGEGFVTLTKKEERVHFALLPYPSPARMSQAGHVPDPEKSYADNVREWLAMCAKAFTASDCNITVSHLFMAGSVRASDEIELGTAALLPLDVLPAAHYTALGHVHKPQCVSRRGNVYYSGSLLPYTFDDDSDKFCNLVHTSPAGVTVEKVPLYAGKRLITQTVGGFDEAMTALQQNADAYVRLLYDSAQPLSAAQYAELRGAEGFAVIRNVRMLPKSVQKASKTLSDRELFTAFYRTVYDGQTPDEEVLAMFEKGLRGEQL